MKKKNIIITAIAGIVLLLLLAAWIITNAVYGEIPSRVVPMIEKLGIAVPVILGTAIVICLTILIFPKKKQD